MAGPQSRAEKVFRGAEALKIIVSPEEYRNLFTLAAEVGKLTLKEVEAYMKKTHLRSEALEWLESQAQARGEQAKALATAQNLLEHGISWDIITSSTGIKPADLKKAAKAAPARKLAKK